MKVFVIPSVFPNKYAKSAGIFVYQQCLALQNAGYEIIVLDASSFSYHNWLDASCNHIQERTEENGIAVMELHFRGLMLSRLPRTAAHAYQKKLNKLFRAALQKYGKPDLLYAHFSFTSGYSAVQLAKEYDIPCAVQEHATLLFSTVKKPVLDMLAYTLDNADRFLCVSPALRKAIEDKHSKHKYEIGILHNMIDGIYQYSPPVEKQEFVFFAAANLIKRKCFDTLITAFIAAFEGNPKISLRIAGSGPEEDDLKKLAAPAKDNILFLGTLNKEQLLQEYMYCDCFALASHTETFGIVYREALAVGRPVVCTRNSGIEYLWNDDYGYLTEQSVSALSAALKKMKENIQHFNTQQISQDVLHDFGEQAFLSSFRKITNEVVV